MELTVSGMARRYGRVVALRDAGMVVRTGEVVGLLGPNGAGKSTLLASVAGLESADAGVVALDGAPQPVSRRREHIVLLPDGIVPWREQSVQWLLLWGAHAFGSGDATVVRDVLGALRIEELRHRPIGELSKGQRKRVLLALVLSSARPFVLMDEPFDGLDLRQTRDAIALLRRVAAAGRGLVISIHDMLDAERACDRLALLHDGTVIAQGTVAELRARAGGSARDLDDVFLALT